MNPQFTQLFLMVVHPPAQKHASFCLAQETPLMLQSLQRTVNVTLQGGAMLMDKGHQGPLCVKDKAKSCRSWTSGVTNVTMMISKCLQSLWMKMNVHVSRVWANKSLNLSVSRRFPSNFHHLPGTEEGDNMLYMFLLNVLTPAQEPLYDAWLQQTLQK